MSFGQAASRRGAARRIDGAASCPCGSGATFGRCCGPLLAGDAAPTAERLMRSRYTAFFVGDVAYLAQTWHPRTRPEDVEIDPDLDWTGLEVVAASAGTEADDQGQVEFRAAWTSRADGAAGEHGVLHERSRFARVRGRWCYLDGEISPE